MTFYFTRIFTSGNLKDIRHDDKITFPSRFEFNNWAQRVNEKNAQGILDYRVEV